MRQFDEQRLGTAEWGTAPHGILRRHEHGDFLLGYLPTGTPVGIGGNRHGMIVAGSRGGKGVSLLVPNLIYWKGSVVVLDPKGENAMVTARRRARGSRYCKGARSRVRILDPFNEVATPEDDFLDLKASYNPLDLIDVSRPESVEVAARIAEAIVASEQAKDPFFDESARHLLQAVCLHTATFVRLNGAPRNLVTVRQLLTAGDPEVTALASAMFEKPPSGLGLLFAAMRDNPAFDGIIARAGAMYAELVDQSPRTLGSILAVVWNHTGFLDSPGIRRCVERSDFRLSDLKTERNGLSLYLCLPQRYMDVHYRWLRMMIALTVTEMEACHGKPKCGSSVLMILDEFAALRRMRVLENAAAQIAGSYVRMIFVLQSLAQAKEIYRDNFETLVASAEFRLFFANDDHFTRDYASKLIGEREIVRHVRNFGSSDSESKGHSDSYSRSASVSHTRGFSVSGNNVTQSWGQSHTATSSMTSGTTQSSGTSRNQGQAETILKRPLVTPDEIGRLFGDRDNPAMLVLVSGCQPMILPRRAYHALSSTRGLYDWHRDHPRPETLEQMQSRRVAEERDAEMLRENEARARYSRSRTQRSYQAWELAQQRKVRAQWEGIEARRQEAVARCQEEEARQARRNRAIGLIVLTPFLLFVLVRLIG